MISVAFLWFSEVEQLRGRNLEDRRAALMRLLQSARGGAEFRSAMMQAELAIAIDFDRFGWENAWKCGEISLKSAHFISISYHFISCSHA